MRYFPTKVHFSRSWRKLSPAVPRSPRMLIASHIKTWIKKITISFTGVSQEPFLCSKLYSFANFVTRYSIINWPKVKGGEWESITFNDHTHDSTLTKWQRGVLSFQRLLLPLIASSPNLYPLSDPTLKPFSYVLTSTPLFLGLGVLFLFFIHCLIWQIIKSHVEDAGLPACGVPQG